MKYNYGINTNLIGEKNNGFTGPILNNGITPASTKIFNSKKINDLKALYNEKLNEIYKKNYDINSDEYLQYIKLYHEINNPEENINDSISITPFLISNAHFEMISYIYYSIIYLKI